MSVFVKHISEEIANSIDDKRKTIKEQARLAAEAGLRLVETLSAAVIEVQKGQKAQNELYTLLDRESKKHGRRYTDIMDLDLANKAITFKQKGEKGETDTEGSG